MLRQISTSAALAVALVLASGGPHAKAALVVAIPQNLPFQIGDQVQAQLSPYTPPTLLGTGYANLILNIPGYGSTTWTSGQGGLLGWTSGSDLTTPGGPALISSFNTACVQVLQDVNWAPSVSSWTVAPLATAPFPNGSGSGVPTGGMGYNAAGLIQSLYTEVTKLGPGNTINPDNPGLNNLNAGAFQMAIWKIEYDYATANNSVNPITGASFTTGNLQVTNGVTGAGTEAALAVSELNGLTAATTIDNVYALTGGTFQDQVFFVPAGSVDTIQPPPVVPEPASLVIWSILAGGSASLAVARKRRQGAGPRWSPENREAILAVIAKDVHE